MEQTTHAARLRYLDADDVDDSVVDFDDLDVYGNDGEKLGELDGFLVEPSAGTVHYLVVDSGGWFTSRRFLVPAEHVTVDREERGMHVSGSKESLRTYPEFDEDRFSRFSDDEFQSYHGRMGAAWTSNDALSGNGTTTSSGSDRQPDWWRSNAYRAERLRPIASGSFGTRGMAAAGGAAAHLTGRDESHRHDDLTHTHAAGHELHTHEHHIGESHAREHVIAHSGDEARRDPVIGHNADQTRRDPVIGHTGHDTRRDHDAVEDEGQRDRDDVSPHFGGRAQPGDILGIETGGETTNIGDTAEAENKRRRTAEEAIRNDDRTHEG